MVHNHGDRESPQDRVVGPLPNALIFMAYNMGVIRSPLTSAGMILQVALCCARRAADAVDPDCDLALITLPETNIAPENSPSQEKTSLPTIHFSVLC